jgi:arsenate reductase
MNTKINTLINQITSEFNLITKERKATLDALSRFIKSKSENTDLIFICVHNSRRSHLSQIWAQVAASYYGFENIKCYSGGTEVTNMFPVIAETLAIQGFNIQVISQTKNPIYALKFSSNAQPIIGFSKLFDDPFNPMNDFGAIMVCSSADSNCPYIVSASQRLLIPFEDPKAFDNKPEQQEKYIERSVQIARELFYAFSQV